MLQLGLVPPRLTHLPPPGIDVGLLENFEKPLTATCILTGHELQALIQSGDNEFLHSGRPDLNASQRVGWRRHADYDPVLLQGLAKLGNAFLHDEGVLLDVHFGLVLAPDGLEACDEIQVLSLASSRPCKESIRSRSGGEGSDSRASNLARSRAARASPRLPSCCNSSARSTARSRLLACSAWRATRSRHAQPAMLPESTSKNRMIAATASPALFRRANFRSRYPTDGGQACTGSSAR